jgi:hypothetical protein
MITSVNGATHGHAAPHPQSPTQQPAQSRPQPAPADTVQLSAAALALKEAIENPAQTTQEAAHGDAQAKRLLAREAADKLV